MLHWCKFVQFDDVGERKKLVAGDWQSNASEAAAYALRVRDG